MNRNYFAIAPIETMEMGILPETGNMAAGVKVENDGRRSGSDNVKGGTTMPTEPDPN
jgi:hypothetical protein